MTAASALLAGRRAAESRMLTTVAIQYPTGNTTQDPWTGSTVDEYETDFTTKARVSLGRGLAVRESEVGGRTAAEVVRELHIPIDSPAVRAGAVALVTEVDPTDDPTLLGARMVLAGPAVGSQTTARRLQVSEVVG